MIIGVTGGIGSGKSKAAKMIAEQGFTLIDADSISREVTADGSPAIDELAAYFGPAILNDNGSLNRHALGQIAFANEEFTNKLNEIVTKRIIEISKERLVGNCVFDAPTLFENHLENLCDVVIVVTADKDIRIARVQKRDGLSRHDVLNIMAKQMPEEEKIEKADIVIYNNGSLDDLKSMLNNALKSDKIGC